MQQTIEHVRQSGAMVALTGCGRDAKTVAPVSGFDTIKFGHACVQRLGRHAESDMIMDALIRVADQYGVVTAADGISTDAQVDMLSQRLRRGPRQPVRQGDTSIRNSGAAAFRSIAAGVA